MEKRKWLWKRKSSEKSPGETDSSGSISSHSERYFDDQEAFKASPNHNTQSPEVTSKVLTVGEDVNDSVTMKKLTEKLSAALVNVSAKEDLVKQHAKVAEDAIAGWEKAENEVEVLKQQLEAAIRQNSALDDRVTHLDGALKECVRQLRLAREEQEQKIHEAVVTKTHEWESTKSELENRLLELQSKAEAAKSKSATPIDTDIFHKLEYLEEENSALKLELLSQSEELEIRTIERDLSTQAAETASKQHLESIRKMAKLEAECRKLKTMACKSSSINDQKSAAASSIYVESLTDSQSDSGEWFNAVEVDTGKTGSSNKCESSCLDSWASALITELGPIKNEKIINRNLTSPSIEIGLMDDFLEMERLAALTDNENGNHCVDSEAIANLSISKDSSLKAELEAMIHRTAELEEKLKKMEAEKAELGMALNKSQNCFEASQLQLREAEMKLEELQNELNIANESKHFIEAQLIAMEVEARTMSAKVDSYEAEIKKERSLSAEIKVKCHELEEELMRKKEEVELQQTATTNSELKIKEEDLVVAAGKLAECQKTIASLGMQLKSLATLEDFLIDTTNLQEFSNGNSQIPKAGEPWKLHSNETFSPKRDSNSSRIAGESSGPSANKNDKNSPPSSSSSTSSSAVTLNHVSSEKNRNGFAKFFTRSKNGIQLEI